MKGQEIAKVTYETIEKPRHNKYIQTGFEIKGLNELIKAFNDLEISIHKLSEPSTQGAEIVAARARGKIHDVSGELADSIKVWKPGSRNKKRYQIFAKVGFSKKGAHGVPLELGHRLFYFGKKTLSDVDPKPFLRPAADESEEKVIALMSDAMQKLIDEMGGLK